MRFGRYRSERSAAWLSLATGIALAAVLGLSFRQLSIFVMCIAIAVSFSLAARNVRPRAWWYASSCLLAVAGMILWARATAAFGHESGTVLVSGGIGAFVGVGMLRLAHNPGASI